MKTVKKLRYLLLVLGAVLMVSCDPDNYQHPEVLHGTWVLTNTKGSDLALTFDDYHMYVQNASSNQHPFQLCDEWSYRMTKDSVLVITTEEDYYDEDNGSETARLKLSFSSENKIMTLVYDPWIGSTRTYTFLKRF